MLDIDSFLEREVNRVKSKKKSLDFEAEVEKSLYELKKEIQKADLENLKSIYKDIIEFDKDLANKFLSISSEATSLINETAERFYKEVYLINKHAYEAIKTELEKLIPALEESLNKKDLSRTVRNYNKIKTLLSKFPEGFLKEKYEFEASNTELINRAIAFIEEYITSIKKNITLNIKTTTNKILQGIKSKNISIIIKNIEKLENTLSTIPPFIASDFLELQRKANNILKIGKSELLKLLDNQFKSIESEIINNINLFHEQILKKNIKDAIITYNLIVNQFEDLPSSFLERKNEILKKIIECFTVLNKSILTHNISLLVSHYNYSKLLKHLNDYYEMISRGELKVDPSRLGGIIKFLSHAAKDNENAKIILEKYLSLRNKIYIPNNSQASSLEQYISMLKRARTKDEAYQILSNIRRYLDTNNMPEETKEKIINKLKLFIIKNENIR